MSFVIWLTGLPCSGKTTIAQNLYRYFKSKNRKVEVIDGDVIRQYISKGLGFSREDRFENIRRVSFLANILSRNDVIAIVAVISPYREMRKMARDMVESPFVEVFVNAPIEVCKQRDVKGMYKKAEMGQIKGFTGVDDPYEPPENPEVECRTDIETVEQSTNKIIDFVKRMGYYKEDV
ncbi:MAG: adenylyl-sulfate kinase [bacterium]|nr:adenylyl-sulfate kinase [bacterium]MDW8086478.1 adenylyl-sulfate kinase [Candidatus Calescibacterium sp.]